MALTGWADFAWQSDYGQFYLIDGGDADFTAPVEIDAALERRRIAVLSAGLVVYTNDCLQQHLRIRIHDAPPAPEPVELMTGQAWTQVETDTIRFPARAFVLSSPSAPFPLPVGPIFVLASETVAARIAWREFAGSRDDSVPVEPDVIQIDLWPG